MKEIINDIVTDLLISEYSEEEVKEILEQVTQIMADRSLQPQFKTCKSCGYKFLQVPDNYCGICGTRLQVDTK